MLNVVTHSGKFHADDVLAWSLLCQFHPQASALRITRTRDQDLIEQADIVFDVGGIFNPSQCRFDHHQNEYQGPLSSAGMVLQWLYDMKYIDQTLFTALNETIVSYVDDVDNGRVEEQQHVPCFSSIVNLYNASAKTLDDFDRQFHLASTMGQQIIQGIHQRIEAAQQNHALIIEAMKRAVKEQSKLIEFPHHVSWKNTYFANNGANHPTEFVMYPTMYNTWQVSAIPPTEHSFAQKQSFPEQWAGLRDEELSEVTGVPSVFCHKNRFIAVFHTRDAALTAMKRFDLL